jgi:hypothetical protein
MNLISATRTKVLLAALIAAATGSAFSYWSAADYEARERRTDVLWLVQDTSLRLRAALAIEPPATASMEEVLRSLYDHAAVVDRHLGKLRDMEVSGMGNLADAADDYLLTSREILLRRASSQRYRLRVSDDLRRLRHHMRTDNRSGAWITAAVRAKERVEEAYRDYRVASTALDGLLQSFPVAQAKIAPHVEAALLIDDNVVNQAHERITVAARETMRELDRYANLNSYR